MARSSRTPCSHTAGSAPPLPREMQSGAWRPALAGSTQCRTCWNHSRERSRREASGQSDRAWLGGAGAAWGWVCRDAATWGCCPRDGDWVIRGWAPPWPASPWHLQDTAIVNALGILTQKQAACFSTKHSGLDQIGLVKGYCADSSFPF